MNIDASTARLTLADVAQTVADADTTRSGSQFSNSLSRVNRANQPIPDPGARSDTFAKATNKAEVPNPRPLDQSEPPAAAVQDPQGTGLTGDLNNDGAVDVLDFGLFASAYASDNPDADLDANGTVDEIDALILRKNFGATADATPQTVREQPPAPNADLNNDGAVNVLDFGLMASAFGSDDPNADLFQDGIVDEIDIAIFRQLFNQPR